MKSLLPLLAMLMLVSCNVAFADYAPLTFVQLIGISDKIIVGEIVAVNEGTVDVKIEDLIVGLGNSGEVVVVRQFRDWACAQRWAKYETHQRVLMFLAGDKKIATTPYRILGAGNEGESEIIDDKITPNFFVGHLRTETQGATRIPIPWLPLRTAICDCCASFRFIPATNRSSHDDDSLFDRIERVPFPTVAAGFQKRSPRGVTPKELPFKKRSSYHRFLADQIEEEQQKIAKYQNYLLSIPK